MLISWVVYWPILSILRHRSGGGRSNDAHPEQRDSTAEQIPDVGLLHWGRPREMEKILL